jgi:uncharacterized protein (DUF427 family)/putative intracellular protease/amidase
MTTTIDIVLFDGVDELDAIGPLEVLRGAAAEGADLEVRLVTRTEPLEVTGNHGLQLRADAVYTPGADILLMPGGGWIARSEAGAWAEAERGDWLPLIKTAADSGVLLAGVCTGVLLLARAGVIGARPATTHHGARADLEAAGVRFVDQRVVDAGGLVTAGGVTSGLDLALHLVERLVSPEAAARQAEALEYPWRPSPKAGTAGGHPAPSGHTITTEPVDGLVTARWGGEVVAQSRDALLLRETGLAPVTYFPIDDVRMDLLQRTEHHTRCPFKGEASYWSIEVGDRRSEDIAWAYEDPLPARADLKGRLAFYADRLEGLEVTAA